MNYIKNATKTENGLWTGAVNCTVESAGQEMMMTKQAYGKEDGIIAYHWKLSCRPGEAKPRDVMRIVESFVSEYLQDQYEVLYAVHTDRNHLHGHILFNSVSVTDGKKYRDKKTDIENKIYPIINRRCVERGLSFIDLTKPKGYKVSSVSYIEWMQHKKGFSTWREMIQSDINHAISISYSFPNFLMVMENMGYAVNMNGKYLKLKPKGAEKWSRLYKMGEGYTEEAIKHRIKKSFYGPIKVKQRSKGRIYRISRANTLWERVKNGGKKYSLFQISYIKYMYLLGKWKKRTYCKATFVQVMKGREIAEQMNYVFFKNIRSKSDLHERYAAVGKQIETLKHDRINIHARRTKYRAIFESAKDAAFYKKTKELYQSGNSDYQDDAQQYDKAIERLAKKGYAGETGLQRIETLRDGFAAELLSVREKINGLEKESKLLKNIMDINISGKIKTIERRRNGYVRTKKHHVAKEREFHLER